jgi:hypothetical protein
MNHATYKLSMQEQKNKSTLPYWVPSPLEMVGTHLFGSQPAVDILEHLLQEIYQLAHFNIGASLLRQILDSIVLPSRMYLFLQ